MDLDLGCLLPVPEENAAAVVVKLNPFTEAQQVQLRAQIIICGSLVRDRLPEETLMSLCFADISQGTSIEDFQEKNLRTGVWEKIWQGSSARHSRIKASPKPQSAAAAAKPLRAPKAAPPKRKAAPVDHQAGRKAPEKKQKVVKEKNINELQAVPCGSRTEPKASMTVTAEETELLQFAIRSLCDESAAAAAAAAAAARKEVYWKSSEEKADNTSKDPGDLTDEKAESVETDDAETSQDLLDRSEMPEEFVKGALVEVTSDEEGLHGAWFSAKISKVSDGSVLIQYIDLLDDGVDGEELSEWVAANETLRDVPRIRLAHPVTSAAVPLHGQNFAVGDHVDAWMNDGWWEGVVEGINTDNRNEVTLFFPGEGDIGKAELCNLRSSLVWKDGRWVSWTQEPPVKKVRQKLQTKLEQKSLAPVKKLGPVLLVEGKRKRERPKRLADGLDDDHPPRKSYTRKTAASQESPPPKKAAMNTNKLKKKAAAVKTPKSKRKN